MNSLPGFFRTYWIEAIFVPPISLVNVWLLYGDFYFRSWHNCVLLTIPLILSGVIIPVLCHRVMNVTLERFPELHQWRKRLLYSVAGYITAIVSVTTLTYYSVSFLPYPELSFSFERWSLLMLMCITAVMIGTASQEGLTYFKKWRAALTEAEHLEKLQLESQFQSLQSQLNPHFLFNSFNVLSSLITENPRKAEDFVDELSNVYRYLLRANEQELARVADELRFIRSYFHLLKTRHDTGIDLKISVDPEFQDRKLPALTLQILVENAVKHNEISPEKPLSINIGAAGNALWVTNNLQRKNARLLSNRIGLDNLRERYQLLNQNGFEVQDDGRTFTVVLPFVN
ncbi:MAG TPA: histidine kinase [Saprospiraceae bacterium]|nr:histidine kinase [Saprospiraceae bacterium]HPI06524.1 histidine kinase [Saprospiraceae bacterium]